MAEVAKLKARYLGYGNGACDYLYPYMLCDQPVYTSVSARGNLSRKRDKTRYSWRLWQRLRN